MGAKFDTEAEAVSVIRLRYSSRRYINFKDTIFALSVAYVLIKLQKVITKHMLLTSTYLVANTLF